jgi:hypothetical protein
LLLKKQLWIWPIIAVVLLAAVGYGIRVAIERTMRANLQSQLQTLLNVERSMLETWLKVQESNVESLANDQQVRTTAAEILRSAGPATNSISQAPDASSAPATTADLHAELAQELSPGMSAHSFVSYTLADKQQRIVSASNSELIGQTLPEYEDS